MAKFQFPRFETIYENREQVIEVLSGLSRSYAEPVAIRYNNSGDIYILIAVFKSSSVGDYDIVHESGLSSGGSEIYTVKRSDNQTDEECINTALFGELPNKGDIVIITEGFKRVTSYIYNGTQWILLSTTGDGSGGSGVSFGIKDTETVNMDLSSTGTLSAKVNIDNESLVYDPEVLAIRVNKIYGGTF